MSLRDFIEARLDAERRVVETALARLADRADRTDGDLREFRRAYESAHEQLRADVINATAADRASQAVGSDRRWLLATSIASLVMLVTLAAFLIEHFSTR